MCNRYHSQMARTDFSKATTKISLKIPFFGTEEEKFEFFCYLKSPLSYTNYPLKDYYNSFHFHPN